VVKVQYTYTVVLFPEPQGGFTVEVPALPGCFSQGQAINEALRNAEEAILCHLESLTQHGDPIPKEGSIIPLNTEELTEALVFRLSVTMEPAEVA